MSGNSKGPDKNRKGMAKVRSKTAPVESIPPTPDADIPSGAKTLVDILERLGNSDVPSPEEMEELQSLKRLFEEAVSRSEEKKRFPVHSNKCGADVCPLCDFLRKGVVG